jgi:hypothetical protein
MALTSRQYLDDATNLKSVTAFTDIKIDPSNNWGMRKTAFQDVYTFQFILTVSRIGIGPFGVLQH